MNLNQVFLIGRLGSDPEMKHFQDGGKIAIVNLAVDSPYWDKDKAHWVSNPAWIRCVFSDKVADRVEKLNKGDEILVQGKIKPRQYEDKHGEKRIITEVKGTFKKGAPGKKSKDAIPDDEQTKQEEQDAPRSPTGEEEAGNNIGDEDDDLPF